jgi:hypothetical protein
MKESYAFSHLTVSYTILPTEGKFIQECLIETGKLMYPYKVNDIKNTNVIRDAVVERVNSTANDFRDQLSASSRELHICSIAIDDSTDVRYTAVLVVFIHGCNSNPGITEELLELIPVNDTTLVKTFSVNWRKYFKNMNLRLINACLVFEYKFQ